MATRSHTVVSIDAASGGQRWAVRVDSVPSDPAGPGYGGLSYSGCTVVVSVVACGDNGDIVGVERESGVLRWRFHPLANGTLTRPDWNAGAAVDSSLYIGSGVGGRLYAITGRTGSLRWEVAVPALSTARGTVSIPAADSDLVVAPYTRDGKPTAGGVIAVDARTGVVRWNSAIPRIAPDSDTGGFSVALWKNIVLASSASGRIFAMDRFSGAVLWSVLRVGKRPPSSVQRDNPMTSDFRPIVVAGSRVYASSCSGWFIGYDLNSHQELWRTDPKLDGSQGSPIVTDGKHVFVVYLTGATVVFSAADGGVTSVAGGSGGPLIIQAILGPDRFFVPGDDGLYAFAK